MKTTNDFIARLRFFSRPILIFLLILLSITACNIFPEPANQYMHPTNSTQVVYQYLTAELMGKLVIANQCLRVINDDGASYLLVWPDDFSVALDGDKVHVTQGVVTGNRKNYDLHIGGRIDIGGGFVNGVDRSSFRISPNSCPGPYWDFGGLVEK